MINWSTVAAFTGPLVAAIIGCATFFAWIGARRETRARALTREIVAGLESNQLLMQQRIAQVEAVIATQSAHLDRQDAALARAMEAIARVEGRLAGVVISAAAAAGPAP